MNNSAIDDIMNGKYVGIRFHNLPIGKLHFLANDIRNFTQ